MAELVIVGRGPAGLSAAVYACRAGIKTTVIGRDTGALAKAEAVENYYGFPEVMTGKELAQRGLAQATRLGAKVVDAEVVKLAFEDKLAVKTPERTYLADAVVLATGASRKVPAIPGLAAYEGKGVSYCAVCDAFFYRGKDVAVLGGGDFALHEAMELLPLAASVTLLPNGGDVPENLPQGLGIEPRRVASFTGGETVETVTFEDGGTLQVAGVFVALGVAGSTDLARQLGVLTEGPRLLVNENMETNVPGVFAAGDCTGGLLQVAKAVNEGAKAGTVAVQYLRKAQK